MGGHFLSGDRQPGILKVVQCGDTEQEASVMMTGERLGTISILLIASGLISLIAFSPLKGETIRFAAIGDYGTNTAAEAQVAELIASWHPEFVIT